MDIQPDALLTFRYPSSFQLLIDRDVPKTCNLDHSVLTFKHPERDAREKWPLCEYGESSIISVYIKPMMSPFLALVHFVRLDSWWERDSCGCDSIQQMSTQVNKYVRFWCDRYNVTECWTHWIQAPKLPQDTRKQTYVSLNLFPMGSNNTYKLRAIQWKRVGRQPADDVCRHTGRCVCIRCIHTVRVTAAPALVPTMKPFLLFTPRRWCRRKSLKQKAVVLVLCNVPVCVICCEWSWAGQGEERGS